jgi:C4-dicarboxylate-specific signal transduction histidine kinase
VIRRIRTLVKKGETEKTRLGINEVIQEVVSLTHSEIQKSGVVLKMNLAGGLPGMLGDRIQLQRVILDLMMNGIEAMNTVTYRPREMLIRYSLYEIAQALVAVLVSSVSQIVLPPY